MNWLKMLRNTVDCPYCGTGYTFSFETKRQEWIANGRKDPLHPLCKRDAKGRKHDILDVGQKG